MEKSIVESFENLEVLAAYDFQGMNTLVRDLTVAIEESARHRNNGETSPPDLCMRRQYKKRRSKKRKSEKPPRPKYGNVSEASESSLEMEEALRDYLENVSKQSDSEEDPNNCSVFRHTLPAFALSCMASAHAAESDSVNETISPMRPHRRKRRCKRMAVDPHPVSQIDSHLCIKHKCLRVSNSDKDEDSSGQPLANGPLRDKNGTSSQLLVSAASGTIDIVTLGKRKRGLKDKWGNSLEKECLADGSCDLCADSASGVTDNMAEDSSSISSSEHDCHSVSHDEGQEGDDEQSDFFHEPGPACGIPGIVPWWETEKVCNDSVRDPNFECILQGSFEYMSPSAQRSFKARLNKLGKQREFRAGRRRLKDRKGLLCYQGVTYSMARFVQERQKWNDGDMRRQVGTSIAGQSSDTKRRRKTPPTSPIDDVLTSYVGHAAEPIPESNIGHQMLRNMGWKPGSGLGCEGDGITAPVVAYLLPKRQGFGHYKSS